MTMSLTSAISNLRAAEIGSQVSMAVARKSLDQQKAQGQAAIQLIESVAQTMEQAIGQAVASGKGGSLDLTA